MSIEEFPLSARKLTEYEALVAAGSQALDAIPGAVYVCDHDGWLACYNSEAVELWGRTPKEKEQFCGSHRLFLPDGTPLAHEDCPMASAIKSGQTTRNAEVLIERPDGKRITVLVNIRPLRDHKGKIQGAINCFQDISAQKHIENEVRRQNRDLEDFFENSAIGLHIVSRDGIILRANKAELELLGYSPEEYVGRHIAEFHVDAPVIGEILQRLACGERLDRHPARLRAKDGSIKHVLITSNSRFVDGKFVNTRCFTTDVTDLNTAELARRESEERLAATYQAANVGIAEADESGRLLRVNDTLCRVLGYRREELLGMSFLAYTHPEDRQDDHSLYQQQIRGEIDSYSLRKRAAKSDGTLLYLDVHASCVRDANGAFRYGVRVIHDVTEAKRLEDRLRDGERHLRDLLEALPAAVYTTDARGRITFYNKASVEMAGRTPRPGDEWCVTWKLYNPDGSPLPHEQCPMAVALREKRPVRGAEAVAERPDGTRIPFIPFPTPLYDSQGEMIGAINMLVDITERKQAEIRLKALIDELNHRVKNTLATVQSLASQTAKHAEHVSDFVPRFEARIIALARAHDLLSKRHWEDAPLDALAHDLLAPLALDTPDKVRIGGPSVSLTPRMALSIAMALNELATNAAKYGSLSAAGGGKLSLTWELDESKTGKALRLDWREHDGPPVTPPTRRGFGMRLMERCIEGELGGAFDLAFERAGVTCRVSIPFTG
jgi:PAS domain S-box-containing protein